MRIMGILIVLLVLPQTLLAGWGHGGGGGSSEKVEADTLRARVSLEAGPIAIEPIAQDGIVWWKMAGIEAYTFGQADPHWFVVGDSGGFEANDTCKFNAPIIAPKINGAGGSIWLTAICNYITLSSQYFSFGYYSTYPTFGFPVIRDCYITAYYWRCKNTAIEASSYTATDSVAIFIKKSLVDSLNTYQNVDTTLWIHPINKQTWYEKGEIYNTPIPLNAGDNLMLGFKEGTSTCDSIGQIIFGLELQPRF